MIEASLLADLRSRGVILTIASGGRLRVRAPHGVLNPSLQRAIWEHRDGLIQLVYELEERAAILEIEQGYSPEDAERLARECVRGGTATPDGHLWLREYAEYHPNVIALRRAFETVFGCGLDIIEVQRVENAEVEAVCETA